MATQVTLPAGSAAGAGARGAMTAELAAKRDATRKRLADVGGALETIRLDLLRLHAGSGDAAALTAALRAAEEVGRDIGCVVDAKAEVDALLANTPTRS
ncbi:MAG: hypothetical protein ACHQQR_16890 [Gemmatimonadales bacterium]